MIRGYVTPQLTAHVTIEIEGYGGVFQPQEIILDTGFNGELVLPGEMIRDLGLSYGGRTLSILADGREVGADYYDGVVLWHGRRLAVEIVETAGESLLGMALLLGSHISIDARVGGEVLIEPA